MLSPHQYYKAKGVDVNLRAHPAMSSSTASSSDDDLHMKSQIDTEWQFSQKKNDS
jgi:hypothetical protein